MTIFEMRSSHASILPPNNNTVIRFLDMNDRESQITGGNFTQRWPMEKWALGPCPLREDANEVGRYRPRNEHPQRSMKLT